MEANEARKLSEERAAAAGTLIKNCAAVKKNAVRSIDLNTITEGCIVHVPTDYKLYNMPITGSTNTYIIFVDTTGVQVPLGPLTRGAKPADGGPYVPPSGSVVTECQKYATYDEFLDANKGAHWLYEKKQEIETIYGGEARNTNVWEINYCKADGTKVQTLAESLA